MATIPGVSSRENMTAGWLDTLFASFITYHRKLRLFSFSIIYFRLHHYHFPYFQSEPIVRFLIFRLNFCRNLEIGTEVDTGIREQLRVKYYIVLIPSGFLEFITTLIWIGDFSVIVVRASAGNLLRKAHSFLAPKVAVFASIKFRHVSWTWNFHLLDKGAAFGNVS